MNLSPIGRADLFLATSFGGAIAGANPDLAKLMILEETFGRARVSKASLEVLGLEVGYPRQPLKSLTGSVVQSLKTLLASPDA